MVRPSVLVLALVLALALALVRWVGLAQGRAHTLAPGAAIVPTRRQRQRRRLGLGLGR